LSLPLSAEALRSVHRCGDKRVLTEAHITFARLEARSGGVPLSRRHLAHARRLLQDAPNRLLDASVKLTHSSVFSVEGDLQSATEFAEAAGREDRKSVV